jgi:tetratricopeptide (TPR) repeat protein
MDQSKFAVKNSETLPESRNDLATLHRDNVLEKPERNLATTRSGANSGVGVTSAEALKPTSGSTASSGLTSVAANASPIEQFAPRIQKDNWDKIGAIAPIISAALIFATGGYCTYTYNQQQIKIQQCQTIEKFIPHLMGNEQTKKAAILALSTLINTETASKFAAIFASTGTVSALQTMSQTGSDKDKLIATQALSSALQSLADRESKLTTIEQDYKIAVTDKTKASADNPDTPYNLNKLAQLYIMRGQYALAEPLLKRSLEIRERVYGPRHPEVVDALKSLAELYQLSGKSDLAETSLKRARDIEENPDFNNTAREPVGSAPVDGAVKQAPAVMKSSTNAKQIPSEPSAKADADKVTPAIQALENRAEQALDPSHSDARQP